MKLQGYLLMAAAAILVLFGAWWLAGVREVGPAVDTGNPDEASAEQEMRVSPALERDPIERGSQRGSPSELPAPAMETAVVEGEQGVVRGTVVDGRNRPVAGAEVAAFRAVDPGDDEGGAVFDDAREDLQVGRTRCRGDGKFELQIAARRPRDLQVSAAGFADFARPDVHAGQELTIVLRRGATLSGVVRSKEGQTPLAGARMFLSPEDRVERLWEGWTDEKGAYLAQNVQPGGVVLSVVPRAQGETCVRLVLEEGETRALDISVPPGVLVTGEVKDAESGQPIEEAEIGPLPWLDPKIARSDAAGRYLLPGVSEEKAGIVLIARAPGYGRFEIPLPAEGNPVLRVDFELVRGRLVTGRVVSVDGTPIPRVRVAAIGHRQDESVVREDRVVAETGSDGGFRLVDVRTDLAYGLLLRKEEFATTIAKRIEGGVAGDVDLGDITMSGGSSLAGSVVTSGGDPLQAAIVRIEPARGIPDRETKTDARGTFAFSDLAAGKQVLHLEVDGVPTKETWTVDLAAGEKRRDLRIVVGDGRSIGGTVIDTWGIGIEGAEVRLSDPSGSRPEGTKRSSTDGRFQFNGLVAGTYDLTANLANLYGPPDDRHVLVGARVTGVDAGTGDVVLRLQRAGEVSGVVTSSNGEGVLGARVVATDARGFEFDAKQTDSRGRFTLRVPAEDAVELRASTSEAGPSAVRAGVHSGERDIVLVVKP